MDSLLLRIITLSMALIALPFIDDGLGVDALHAQQSQATALGRRSAGQRIAAAVASLTPFAVVARPEGVNKPELLPTTLVDGRRPNVIDVKVNFLTKGEQKRLDVLAAKTEKASGFKIRVLCQSYPETPGLAIKDYWKVDDKTVVLIADKGLKGTSNILNFNGRFGTSRYWRDKGEDVAITNAVEAIAYCLQQEDGRTDPPSRDLIDAKL
ncbi:hypothetical protein JL720_479 [Aureococcus anophagefferens]|nr:hypothetical protein JL720_479 [Aureococcus anophagefferens]